MSSERAKLLVAKFQPRDLYEAVELGLRDQRQRTAEFIAHMARHAKDRAEQASALAVIMNSYPHELARIAAAFAEGKDGDQ